MHVEDFNSVKAESKNRKLKAGDDVDVAVDFYVAFGVDDEIDIVVFVRCALRCVFS